MTFFMDILFDNDSDDLVEVVKTLILKRNVTSKDLYRSLSKYDLRNHGKEDLVLM